MKRRLLILGLLLALSLCACTKQNADYFAPFREGFVAQIEGEFHGISFAAQLACEEPREDGGREATLTFYAPESLSDTVLFCDADGALFLRVGGVTQPAPREYAALLSLFPSHAVATGVTREGEGTRVVGDGFSLSFLADGTPVRATCGEVSVRVLSFSQK